jgi:hypothetical protein
MRNAALRLKTRANTVVTIYELSPSVIATHLRGFFFDELIDHQLAALETHAAQSPTIHHFFDWSEMTGYSSDARKRLTEWKNQHEHVTSHLLVKSAIVAMGVNMANRVLGGSLDVTPKPDTFFQKLVEALGAPQAAVVEAIRRRDDSAFEIEVRDLTPPSLLTSARSS